MQKTLFRKRIVACPVMEWKYRCGGSLNRNFAKKNQCHGIYAITAESCITDLRKL